LLKAFKYFDLDNSGECSKDEFLKAITKIGITGFSDKNLLELFDLYDSNQNETLDYKEFSGILFDPNRNTGNVANNVNGNVSKQNSKIVKSEEKEDKRYLFIIIN